MQVVKTDTEMTQTLELADEGFYKTFINMKTFIKTKEKCECNEGTDGES